MIFIRNKNSLIKLLLSIILALIFFPNIIHSTVLKKFNLEELIKDAELIFVGKVTNITSRWGDEGKTIYTYVTFSDIENIDGFYDKDNLNLRFEGGSIGPHSLIIPGIPEFKIGEKHLLFMRGNNVSKCPLSGWIQGDFKITKDKFNNSLVINSANEKIVGIKDNKLLKKSIINEDDTRTREEFYLENFISEIKRIKRSIPLQQMRKRVPIKNIEIPASLDQEENLNRNQVFPLLQTK